ncbi:hypothetical protein [Salipiger mangrovisoli]|nr:hypothetical protein [Salipiger mangrovisoli]
MPKKLVMVRRVATPSAFSSASTRDSIGTTPATMAKVVTEPSIAP